MISTICISAQNKIIFPGISPTHKQKILNTKIPFPLPTWLPEGFKVTHVITKTGKSIRIDNKVLSVTYAKKLSKGTLEFVIEAGFDGIGSMDYEGEKIETKVGDIYLYYEPYEDIGEGKKARQWGMIRTEWFDVKELAFYVGFSQQSTNESVNKTKPKISKAVAKRILQSIQILR